MMEEARSSPSKDICTRTSEDLDTWLCGYNDWANSYDWVEDFKQKEGCDHEISYPGGPPPITKQGNPSLRREVKVVDGSVKFTRTAEKAVEFYNEKQGADFELVEVVSGNWFFCMGFWEHINFKAKPKTATGDDQSRRFFFAELSYGAAHFGRYFETVREGEITACSLLEEGSTKDYCGFCPNENKIYHPRQGFTIGIA